MCATRTRRNINVAVVLAVAHVVAGAAIGVALLARSTTLVVITVLVGVGLAVAMTQVKGTRTRPVAYSVPAFLLLIGLGYAIRGDLNGWLWLGVVGVLYGFGEALAKVHGATANDLGYYLVVLGLLLGYGLMAMSIFNQLDRSWPAAACAIVVTSGYTFYTLPMMSKWTRQGY